MWENGNNDTGLPTMKVATQNCLKGLLKPKTVDACKTLFRKVRGKHTFMERRAMCLPATELPPQPVSPKYK